MNRKLIGLFVVFLIAILITSGCTAKEEPQTEKPIATEPAVPEGEVLKFAVYCTTTPTVGFRRYQPLMNYLKEETGLNIKLVLIGDYTEFFNLQKQEEADFVILDAFSAYLTTKHTHPNHLVPLVNAISPKGDQCDSGYIVVRADSDIEDLNDLKGRTVLFGPKANAAKFLAPYVTLKKSGIDVEKDLTYEFGGRCPDNAMSVYLGEYDAGAICGHYPDHEDKKLNFETDLRIIAETECLPYWIVSATEETDAAGADKVKQALLKLNKDNPKTSELFIDVCKWKGFTEYSDEIDRIEELVQEYSVPIE